MKRIGAVILAAGQGSRFGSHKLLRTLDDSRALIEHAIDPFIGTVDELLIVGRSLDNALQSIAKNLGIRYSAVVGRQTGMGWSLAHGVTELAHLDGWLVGLGDMPWVRQTTVRSVVEALRDGATIARPRYAGSHGHPVGFSRDLLPLLRRLRGDEGGRSILLSNNQVITEIAVADPGTVLDVDTPADLSR